MTDGNATARKTILEFAVKGVIALVLIVSGVYAVVGIVPRAIDNEVRLGVHEFRLNQLEDVEQRIANLVQAQDDLEELILETTNPRARR